MYTSINSSSPVRTSTSETSPTNYRTQADHFSNSLQTMNDRYTTSQRATSGYSNSVSSLNAPPSSSRTYTSNYNQFPSNQNRYPYRTYGNDNDTYRSNSRAYSYDDLRNERNRSPSRPYQPYTPQPTRREQYNDYDDDLIVKSTDLPATYEQEMIDLVRAAFRKYEITNQRELAGFSNVQPIEALLPVGIASLVDNLVPMSPMK